MAIDLGSHTLLDQYKKQKFSGIHEMFFFSVAQWYEAKIVPKKNITPLCDEPVYKSAIPGTSGPVPREASNAARLMP